MQICLDEAAKKVWTLIGISSPKPRFTLKNEMTVIDFPTMKLQGTGWYLSNGFAPSIVSASFTYYRAAAACSISEKVVVRCGG